MWRCLWWLLAGAVCWPLSSQAQTHIEASVVGAGEVRVDGALSEWRGQRFGTLGDDDTGQLRYRVAVDDRGLYVAARVSDDHFVRSARPSPREDAIVLTLALPTAGGVYRARELWLFAGIEGSQPAEAALGIPGKAPTPMQGVQIVEGPLERGQGYELEAFVPWSMLAGGANWAHARAAIRLQDVDARGARDRRVYESAKLTKAARLPPLLIEGSGQGAYLKFLSDKGLAAAAPRFDALGDVAAGPALERVIVTGTFVVVFGPEVAGGSAFHFADLPVTRALDVLSADLRDQQASGKQQLVLRLRQSSEQGSRELLRVLDLSRQPFAVLSDEITPQDAHASPTTPTAGAVPVRTSHVQRVATRAEPPGTDALVAAFVAARGLPRTARPRFISHVNLAEDGALESVMLFGTELLVVGKGFRDGTGYFYFGLPVRDASDVLRVFTADVTGDGRREVFARLRQRIGDVQRELLMAYTFDGEVLRPILGVEVRRAQGEHSIGNVVRLVAQRGHWALQIDAGRATGWNETNYPFVAESQDDFGPLMLPWREQRVRYRYQGGMLQR